MGAITKKIMINLFKQYKRYKLRKDCFEQHQNIEYKKIGAFLTLRQIGRAFVYFSNNSGYVWNLIKSGDILFAPSKEDRSNPYLWKAGSWRWFISFFNEI
jgi:hypothetical protein